MILIIWSSSLFITCMWNNIISISWCLILFNFFFTLIFELRWISSVSWLIISYSWLFGSIILCCSYSCFILILWRTVSIWYVLLISSVWWYLFTRTIFNRFNRYWTLYLFLIIFSFVFIFSLVFYIISSFFWWWFIFIINIDVIWSSLMI